MDITADQQKLFASLQEDTLSKAVFSVDKKRRNALEEGFIGFNDFVRQYASVCTYAALKGQVITVVAGRYKDPVLTIAPESAIELPDNVFIHEVIDNLHARGFLALSLPEPHATKYRQGKRSIVARNAAAVHGGKLLGPDVLWRQRTTGASAIVGQFGKLKFHTNALKLH